MGYIVEYFYSEVPEECPLKAKKVEDTKKEEKTEDKEETNNVENGEVKEKNGKQDAEEEEKGIFQFSWCHFSDILNVFTAFDVG